MNDIINKFLLVGDEFKPEMILDNQSLPIVLVDHLHDMAYGYFKDLSRRTAADNVLRDEAFNIAENPKYDTYQRGLASMIYKFFDKNTKGSGVTLANKSAIKSIPQNEQLAEELHKPIIRKLKKS